MRRKSYLKAVQTTDLIRNSTHMLNSTYKKLAKAILDFYLGPFVGSLSLTIMVGDGRVLRFLLIWSFLFLLLGLFSTWMASLNKIQGDLFASSFYSRFFSLLAGIPFITIVSDILNFNQNAWIIVISLIAFIGASFEGWKILVTGSRKQWTWPSGLMTAFMCSIVLILWTSGLLLRLQLVPRGLPYEYYWDEPFGIGIAIRILKTHSLDPRLFWYPSFMAYLQTFGAFVTYAILKNHHVIASTTDIMTGLDTAYIWTISHSLFWYVGRIMNILYASLGMLVVFVIGQKLNGFWSGVIAIGLMAFSPPHIDMSAWIMVDPLTATNSCLWALCVVLGWQANSAERKQRLYWLTALLAGITISTKYNALPILLPTLLVPLWDPHFPPAHITRFLVRSVLFALVGFFIVTPFAIFDFAPFVADLTGQFKVYATTGHDARDIPIFSKKFAHDFQFLSQAIRYGKSGLFLLWLSILIELAIGVLQAKRRSPLLILILFPALYLLLMAKMKVNFERNLLLVIPFMTLTLGYWTGVLQKRISGNHKWVFHLSGFALGLYLFGANCHSALVNFEGLK